MALETLKGITSIGDFKIARSEHESRYIAIHDEENCIGFKLQNGPIKEVGVNGCQVDTLIETAKVMIEGLHKKFPHVQNEHAIQGLTSALYALEQRTKDREALESVY